MIKYKILVVWHECTIVEVEAEDIDEAVSKVEEGDIELPEHGDYISDSMQVDFEGSLELNRLEYNLNGEIINVD